MTLTMCDVGVARFLTVIRFLSELASSSIHAPYSFHSSFLMGPLPGSRAFPRSGI